MPARHLHPTPSIPSLLFVLRADARSALGTGWFLHRLRHRFYCTFTAHDGAGRPIKPRRAEGGTTFSFHSCSSCHKLFQEDASFDSFHCPSLIHKPTRARTSKQGDERQAGKLPRDIHFLPTEPIILLAILNSDECVVVVCRAGKLNNERGLKVTVSKED